jgi:hypothetical protein
VPKDGATLPALPAVPVAPTATDGYKSKVEPFDKARRLSNTVSLEAGESGVFEILEDGAPHTARVVHETTTFESVVIP